jgi:hypothetical protein
VAGYVRGRLGQDLAEEFQVSRRVIALVLVGDYTRWRNPDEERILEARGGRQNRFLTEQDIKGMRKMRFDGAPLSEIAAMYLVSDSTVSRVVRGVLHGPVEAR